MDMSDVSRSTARSPAVSADTVDGERWRDVVSAVGSEIAAPLTSALERIHALVHTGRIDKASLRALREEVEVARRAGMVAQQLTRFASARLRQSHERLALSDTLQAVLAHRTRETQARGITVQPTLKAVDVIVDPSLLFCLLNTLLDWALTHARSQIDLTIDMKAWPAHGRLSCHFTHRPLDELDDGAEMPAASQTLYSLSWRLLEQTAWTMGLPISRHINHGEVRVTIEFPRTAHEQVEGLSAVEIDQGVGLASGAKPLAGSHVLVIASRRDMRVRVRDAIRHMGLVIDLVASVDEAHEFCRDGLPHAIIVEGILHGERLRQLQHEVQAEQPDFPYVEIIEEGASFAMSGFGGATMGRVGRDAIESALPSVLMFELSRTL